MNKTKGPRFEERLKGYGFDKNTHAFHLAIAGFKFFVLSDVFMIHLNHERDSWGGPRNLDRQQWDILEVRQSLVYYLFS